MNVELIDNISIQESLGMPSDLNSFVDIQIIMKQAFQVIMKQYFKIENTIFNRASPVLRSGITMWMTRGAGIGEGARQGGG